MNVAIVDLVDELLGRREVEMLEDHRRQQRRRAAAIELPHDRGQSGAPEPEAATLVAEQIPPPTRARGTAGSVASIGNGSRARNDHHTRPVAGTSDKRDKRVV